MSRKIITQDTIDVIEDVTLSLYRQRYWPDWREFELRTPTTSSELNLVKRRLILLNELLQHDELSKKQETSEEEKPSTNWLFYEEEEEIIPIYDEAIGILIKKLIVKPAQISYLLAYMGIPGHKSVIDVENHDGKGYHFHYGKVKNDTLERYNVLMTFDKRNVNSDKQPITNIPLHVEPHAAGKCKHIDASTIGHNRRLPIYLVCEKAMKSRGLENFLSPSNNSSVFYPMA
jgi:hypothetical protein